MSFVAMEHFVKLYFWPTYGMASCAWWDENGREHANLRFWR